MHTETILMEQRGEISYTPKDVAAPWRGQVDLSEKCNCCYTSDDWRLVPVDRWALCDVLLPDWLSADQFCANPVAYKYFVGLGGNPEWPREWYDGLRALSERKRYAAIKLLNVKKFRSQFRQSLRNQLEDWLNNPEGRKYPSPFSPRQWDCVFGPYGGIEAKRACESLYRAGPILTSMQPVTEAA